MLKHVLYHGMLFAQYRPARPISYKEAPHAARRCSVIITNESERAEEVKENERKKGDGRESRKANEGKRNGRDIKGELSFADIQTIREVMCACTRPERETSRNYRERYFGAEVTRLRGSKIRLVGKAVRCS